ncbi:hypothetical protein LINPERPRIM_LOCUS15026, partial [Linum perenne]
MLKERPSWKEIVRPVVTRFATHFELLKSTFAHKAHLWTLFGSTFFEADATSSTTKGMKVVEIVQDSIFLGDCLEIVKGSKYKPYINIVDRQCDKNFKGDMHRATYFFNSAFAYKYVDIPEDVVKSAVLNLLEKPTMCSDPMTTMKKLKLYEEAKNVWWNTFGIVHILLKRLQFEFLAKHQHYLDVGVIGVCLSAFILIGGTNKLCDLVFVHYNLKLKN